MDQGCVFPQGEPVIFCRLTSRRVRRIRLRQGSRRTAPGGSGRIAMPFDLHPVIVSCSLPVGDLQLSRVLLMNDARFPWLMLIPRRAGVIEVTDLPAAERTLLMDEIAAVSTALRQATQAQRINVGALGNLVPQLHVHVVARFATDAAWPGPVWGHGSRQPYADEAAEAFKADIARRLTLA
jgi:diadenosine tetraphosphate (Ap4A) HIT family hydrolase